MSARTSTDVEKSSPSPCSLHCRGTNELIDSPSLEEGQRRSSGVALGMILALVSISRYLRRNEEHESCQYVCSEREKD